MEDQDKYNDFWKWFEKNSDALFSLENNKEILDKLKKELHKINENLTYEFGRINNGKRDFAISADGIREAFPFVEKLFDMKPLLNKWTIKKFRQRGDISLIITKNDITLYHENIRYLLFPYENKIGLFLYMKGFNENKDAFIDLAFLFLDNALGEYDVVTKIGGIEFKEYNTEDFEKSKSIETFIDEFDNMKI